MEFPEDIWREIVGFLPHVYRKPTHYDAIMAVDAFRNRRHINKNPFARNPVESFYAHIIVSSWWYWTFPDIQNLMIAPDVLFSRNVAKGRTKTEFIEIFDAYAQSDNSLSHIQYVV